MSMACISEVIFCATIFFPIVLNTVISAPAAFSMKKRWLAGFGKVRTSVSSGSPIPDNKFTVNPSIRTISSTCTSQLPAEASAGKLNTASNWVSFKTLTLEASITSEGLPVKLRETEGVDRVNRLSIQYCL